MRYKELDIWKRSYQVANQVYSAMKTCRDFGFKDQICRSAVSVPSNIAEGSERGSSKDNIRFLYYAKGSCAELSTQLLLAGDFGYLPQQYAFTLEQEVADISRMIAGYINYLLRNNIQDAAAEYRLGNEDD
ncbi:four helix bundle protein [Photobacterium nomapromontoriensis]|uniref:four helix bundle protein n=1 Tax=Photobacterium nomapromontoriensis TaxID=2910237 RepID=UPI003D09C694